jgi:hypothetical protein
MERQKNLRQIETFLHEGVLQGIRGMLPVKSILREYLKEDDDEDEEVEETEEEVKKVEEDVQPTQTEIVSPPPAAAAAAAVAAAPPAVVVAAAHAAPASPTVVAATSQITGSDTKDANNDIVDIFEDDGRDIEEVKILEDIPPEPLEDFVDLDTNQNMMPMDFEELA